MVHRLKDFIKSIRACKTAADERAVVAKESAAIRTVFKEENADSRHQNVSKLLYIHMLGYPAHFGQMECVKLVASPRFADKRLGYLGIMLLLDENQETLTLVTNSLKNDMNSANTYVVGLALCTLGNISSVAMARDLWPEVEKLAVSSNSYVRKKAALCAVRVIRKVPDLQENFLARTRAMLGDRNHGALLTGLTLISEISKISPSALAEFKQTVPALVQMLKQLITTGYSPEHDVSGITDPFLQVKILRLLRQLGAGDPVASETMNDVLAQVATNTDGAKNVGNAILYETVLTILEIQAEPTLRVLAINILGKFLSNTDNNIRYVALQTLMKTIQYDVQAVQRHRTTILDCLRDPDISIRRRALELAFALVNAQNVRAMIRELLLFLEIADIEFRTTMVAQICSCADNFAPNKRWHLDTMVRVMKLAGNHVREEIVARFVRLVTNSSDLQAYTATKLYHLLKADQSQEGLVHAGVWVIGEFGDVTVQPGQNLVTLDPEAEEDAIPSSPVHGSVQVTPSEEDVVTLLDEILVGSFVTQTTKQYVLAALMKLSTRFTSSDAISKIKAIIQRFTTSMNLELQQRAVEYMNMFQLEKSIRAGLWERMPVMELKEDQYAKGTATAEPFGSPPKAQNTTSALLELEGLNLGGGAQSSAGQPSSMSLIQDIFGNSGASSSPAKDPLSILMGGQATKSNPLGDLLGGASPPAQVSESASAGWNQAYPAYRSGEISITLTPSQVANPGSPPFVHVVANVVNHGASKISGLQIFVAVPKTHRVAMAPISEQNLEANGCATQEFRVATNEERRPIKLRLKIAYTVDARDVENIADFAFPDNIN